MHFYFKTDFLYYKNTQNVPYISGLNSQKNFTQSVFLLSSQQQISLRQICRLIYWFLFKTTTEYFLQLPLVDSKFHRCILNRRGEDICWICLKWTALAFLCVHQRANGRLQTDQSECALYFRYVINLIVS